MTVVWPDWTNPQMVNWWTANFRRFFDLAGPLSAIWLDMMSHPASAQGRSRTVASMKPPG